MIKGEKNKIIEAISASIDNSLYWNISDKKIIVSVNSNNNFLELIVRDRGPGISNKDKKKYFFKGI